MQRQCIVAMYFEGLTPSEIAQREGRSINTVKSWVRLGLMRMRGGVGHLRTHRFSVKRPADLQERKRQVR